jgi:hypothetical protein
MRTEQNSVGLLKAVSDKLFGDTNSRMKMSATPAQDVYEIRPRKDRDGFDLISDRLRHGPNLVCRTRRSPLRGCVRDVPLSLSLAPGDHPRV